MNLELKKRVLKRDKYICKRCGAGLYLFKKNKRSWQTRKGHIHHILHKENGGFDIIENLLSTCWKCEIKYHNQF